MTTTLPTMLARFAGTVVVVDETMARVHAELLAEFDALPPVATPENVHQHDAFAGHAAAFRKGLEAARKAAKEPSLREGKGIDGVAAAVDAPIEAALRVASAAVLAVKRQVEQARAAAEAARRKAEQEAEERERILLAERLRLAATPELVGELAALAELEAEHREAGAQAYLASLDAVPDDLGTMAVNSRKVWTLVVDDLDAVPCIVAGVCIRPVDEAAVRRLLRAGVSIPGLRWVEEQGSSTRAR